MARKKTLVKLVDDLRAEIRASLNPAHNSQAHDAQVKLLQRTQDWLYEDYDWPHLKIERLYPAQAGQRYYDFGADFDLERINEVSFKVDGRFRPLLPEITDAHYLAHDSDLDARAWPIRAWRIHENDEVEAWPIADQNGDATTYEGYFKVKGIKRLAPFIADTDRADLDDRLIVLYAAAEMLGAKEGQTKLSLANDRAATLRGKLTKKTRFQMFGIGGDTAPRRPLVQTYRPPSTS